MRLITVDSSPLETQSIVTVGTFDGFHRGHQYLIQHLVDQAQETNLSSVVVTFDQHPKSIIAPAEYSGELIYLQHKVYLLEQAGVDICLLLPPTPELFALNPEEFYTQIILPLLNPHTVLVGRSHTFGKNKNGSPETLKTLGKSLGFETIIADLYQDNDTVNSTTARKSIAEKNLPLTEQLLGHPLYLTGTVIRGKQRGRTLGYPTANIHPSPNSYQWPSGVYAVYCHIAGKRYRGSLSIGTNPSVENSDYVHHEVYIHNFDQDIYGEPILLELKHFIREQKTYQTLTALKQAIQYDVLETQNLIIL